MATINIEGILKVQPETCTCQTCKTYCKRPCWGTPDQIRRIIDAGYGDRLQLDWFEGDDDPIYILCGASKGHEGKLAPSNPLSSWCTFFCGQPLPVA